MQLTEHFEGTEIDLGSAIAFLGNKNSSGELILPSHQDQAQLAKIHQKHTDIFVEAKLDAPLEVADAHWTRKLGLALRILTADCAPLLLFCPQRRTIAAIHAGWRGVASQITVKTIHHLLSQDLITKNVQIVIGPHIQWNSFEIEESFALQLTNTVSWIERDQFLKSSGKKFFVDLNQILQQQILRITERPENIQTLFVDTKTDLQFHSYRRDGTSSGRQSSYIFLKHP
ncbi:MAG: polyphenol oxidase family protein [Pseudobdellovibrionaceae bacterium]|jgi:hypothetical protein